MQATSGSAGPGDRGPSVFPISDCKETNLRWHMAPRQRPHVMAQKKVAPESVVD
jgi:hypothetical protein